MPRLKVLFLCTGNSCRSQMAEGWARRLKADSLEPYSAGTHPKGIDPLAAEVMAEGGAPLNAQTSKRLNDLLHINFDFVITVCDSAHEACPIFPSNTTIIHRGFDDPPRLAQHAASDEERKHIYRRVRDEIKAFIETLPDALI